MKFLLNGDLNMRLHNVYYVCKAALNGLAQIKAETLKNGAKQLNGWAVGKQAIESLLNIDFIKDDAQGLYDALTPMDRRKANPDIAPETFNEFDFLHKRLMSKLESVVDLYESMRDGTSQHGIDVKIPSCASLKDYIKILNDLDFVFAQCPYLKDDNEEIKYRGTDVGSDWITFAVVGSGLMASGLVILNNLAILVNQAVAIQSNKKILDMQNEVLQSMHSKNEVTQEVVDIFKAIKKTIYKQYIDDLQDKLGVLEDKEEIRKLEIGLEKLANLIDKGVQIHASIETPKDIKELFPFVETRPVLTDNLIKCLEDKSDNE